MIYWTTEQIKHTFNYTKQSTIFIHYIYLLCSSYMFRCTTYHHQGDSRAPNSKPLAFTQLLSTVNPVVASWNTKGTTLLLLNLQQFIHRLKSYMSHWCALCWNPETSMIKIFYLLCVCTYFADYARSWLYTFNILQVMIGSIWYRVHRKTPCLITKYNRIRLHKMNLFSV
jgi:hypothetical protein